MVNSVRHIDFGREASLLFTRMQVQPEAIGKVHLYKRFKDDGLMVIEGSDAQVLELIRGWNRTSSWKVEKVTLCRPDTTTMTTEILRDTSENR